MERILMEFFSKSIEIGLESSWSIPQWNHSFQYQWKLVWRALGQFPNEILKEFLSISMEICLERIRMEFVSKLMENWSGELLGIFPMESLRNSFQNQWTWSGENPYGIRFKINGNWSGELLVNFLMDSLRNSFQYQWKSVWRESLWNSVQNQ